MFHFHSVDKNKEDTAVEGMLSVGFVAREMVSKENIPIRTIAAILDGLIKPKLNLPTDLRTFLQDHA